MENKFLEVIGENVEMCKKIEKVDKEMKEREEALKEIVDIKDKEIRKIKGEIKKNGYKRKRNRNGHRRGGRKKERHV